MSEARQFGIVLRLFSTVLFKFVAVGLVLSAIVFGFSLWQTGARATYLHLLSVVPVVVMAVVGVIRVGILLGTYYARRPKE